MKDADVGGIWHNGFLLIVKALFDGFVKSNTTFIITDDLKVVPDSLDTIFHLLKNCGVEDLSLVNEMTMTITKNQVVDLLNSCLVSKTTLTDSFLKKEPSIARINNMKLDSSDSNANGSDIINVKIMQRKSNGKILFAQGKEDFVNFLFNFLTFPLGEVVHLLEDRSSVGSVNGLYNSIVDLDEDYWTTKDVKNKLVNTGFPSQFKLSNPQYFCNTVNRSYNVYDAFSRSCNSRIGLTSCYLTSTFRELNSSLETCTATEFVYPMSESGKGYVRGQIWYMATDDLVVTPMSSTCLLSLLKTLSIPLSDLEEKVVSIGVNEGVKILQASLTSTSALTIGLSHLLTKVKEETE